MASAPVFGVTKCHCRDAALRKQAKAISSRTKWPRRLRPSDPQSCSSRRFPGCKVAPFRNLRAVFFPSFSFVLRAERRGDAHRRRLLSPMGWLTRHPPWPGPHPSRGLRSGSEISRTEKSRGSKDLLLLCSLMPHRLFRFLAGDHYGKGKSIRDDR